MASMYVSGKTLQEIADGHGISRQRVQQILKKLGLSRDDGGSRARSVSREAERLRSLDRRYLAKWGVDFRCFVELRSKGAVRAYSTQRTNAAMRGIPWKLSLCDWWRIWEASGMWPRRGRGDGRYVMSRPGDQGSYEVGNVKIVTINENSREYAVRRWKRG